ncbi:MAG: aminotransferase class I/II-fold pyridoxal phosphate-dependent enzyme [bacterium]|nr:aminotransferase class I/II-fold pyridoxal phosphate-dependent enzyme [bacterium]
MSRQSRAPYYEALISYSEGGNLGFHMPGHMQGKGASTELMDLLGAKALRADITQVLDIDDIHRPYNALKEAQELAAEAYGSDHVWFLVNGSTAGNQAMLFACLNPGDKVLLPRNVHRSVYAGLVLSGAVPVYLRTPYDPEMGVYHVLEPSSLEAGLKAHPDAKACFWASVSPYGAGADVEALTGIAHAHGLPALVDEAWGPHLVFSDLLPESAVTAGADLVVQSAHKLLPALSQASFLHYRRGRVSKHKVSAALRLLQTTSPNFLLPASLDLARRQMCLEGRKLWDRACQDAQELASAISAIPGFRCLEPEGAFSRDVTRLVVTASEIGLAGTDLECILRYDYHIQAEMSDMRSIVFIYSPWHSQADRGCLLKALANISLKYARKPEESDNDDLMMAFPAYSELAVTPREAFYGEAEDILWSEASGRISAEVITPYPPGIPLVCPGEIITSEQVAYVRELRRRRVPIEGMSDPSGLAVRVLK